MRVIILTGCIMNCDTMSTACFTMMLLPMMVYSVRNTTQHCIRMRYRYSDTVFSIFK
jgi:hypothetical protein